MKICPLNLVGRIHADVAGPHSGPHTCTRAELRSIAEAPEVLRQHEAPSPLLLASCFLPCGPSHAHGHSRHRLEGRWLSRAPVTAKGQPSSQGNSYPQQAQVTSNPRPLPALQSHPLSFSPE